MKHVFIIPASLLIMLSASVAEAWNLNAMHVNALRFDKNGKISFTMFEEGNSGNEFKCQGAQQWFEISACSTSNQICIESVNRMTSMLLSAKMAGRAVHVQHNNCQVTETALKP